VLGRWDTTAKRNDALDVVRVTWIRKGATGITRDQTFTRKGAAVAKTAPSRKVDAWTARDTLRRRSVVAANEVRLAKWILTRRGVADVVTTDEMTKRKRSVMVAVVMPGVMSS
jgi:hypothetical protein